MAMSKSLFFAGFLAAAALSDEHGTNPVQSALDVDGECSEDGDACAVNALQQRIGKIAGHEAETATDGSHPIVSLELFRPLNHKFLGHKISNMDMFSIPGVLHYLHTQVVWEHVGDWTGTELKEPRMKTRAEDLDVIVGINANIRNPNSVISEVGEVNSFVDFAAIALFVDGEATGPAYNWDYGDIVGATTPRDAAYPTIDPYYRFSLSGYCPNLKWNIKRKKHTKKTGTCVRYSDHYDLPEGEIIRGGLCPNGTDPGVMPTGGPGCSYTYTPPTRENVTKIDVLVGITDEDCGGRKCKNWRDFRSHCTNKRYKVKFNYLEKNRNRNMYGHGRRRHSSLLESGLERLTGGPRLQRTPFCVEYDIVKACAKDCFSKACQAIPANRREVGLPFWKGRCDPVRNAQRAEKLAEAMGIADATKTHDLLANKKFASETCLSNNPDAMCRPDPKTGGMYCSRNFAGVCQPCFIPGTLEYYKHNTSMPTCPWNVLWANQDYSNMRPQCASQDPADFCCLYSNSCNQTLIDDAKNESMPPTDAGFAYLSSLQDNNAMVEFLQRAVTTELSADASDLKGFDDFVYWKWVGRPIPGSTLNRVLGQVKRHLS